MEQQSIDQIVNLNFHYWHLLQPVATIESRFSNTRHTIGDNNGGKGGAMRESRTSNTRYTIGDNNGGKGGATNESTISNTRDAIGDSDRG